VLCNNQVVAAPPRDERLLDAIGRVIRHLSRLSGGPDDGPPMTATQRLALFETLEAAPIRLSDLSERLCVSAPTASRAVDALVELGLLERVPDPSDRRAVRISPTPSGRKRAEERKARVLEAFRPTVAKLAASDQEQLIALLDELDRALAPERSPTVSP
jgi:DNA-binding MarR family transcriptional regulator